MTQLVNKILYGLGKNLGKIVLSIFSSLDQAFDYLQARLDYKQKKEAEKKLCKDKGTIEDVVQHGNIEDLLELK